jgi:hypothetical protein
MSAGSSSAGILTDRARFAPHVVKFDERLSDLERRGLARRNPDDSPNTNLDGYNFWLNKLNQFSGNFLRAEMVRSFRISTEYRERFGP